MSLLDVKTYLGSGKCVGKLKDKKKSYMIVQINPFAPNTEVPSVGSEQENSEDKP